MALDAITGQPLSKVAVHLGPEGGPNPGLTTTTDSSGRFHFEGFPPGDYSLEGERTGYLASWFGARKPDVPGTVLRFKSGDTLSDLQLKLLPHSVISGKVVDENGDPVPKAHVSAYTRFWLNGRRQYGFSVETYTNDAGRYRIAKLDPNVYYLYVDPEEQTFVDEQGGPEKRLLPAFYPGGRSLTDAAQVEVFAGRDLTGIDFHLHTGPVFHIRGNLAGKLADRTILELEAQILGLQYEIPISSWQIESSGAFDIADLPAGNYQIEVTDEHHNVIARLPVELHTKDVNGVVITFPESFVVNGVIQRDAELSENKHPAQDDEDLSGVSVELIPDGEGRSESYPASVASNGTFRIQRVPAGKYAVAADSGDPAEYVKSVRLGGREIIGQLVDFSAGTSGQIEIVIAKGAGQVRGKVQAQNPDQTTPESAALSDLSVVLVSDPLRHDLSGVFFTRPDQNGQFLFKTIPPGKYLAFAGADLVYNLFDREEFLEQFSEFGTHLEVGENGVAEIQLSPLDPDVLERAATVMK